MHDWLLQYGLPALFLLSFIAATLLPLGSEWLLMALLANGHPPLTCVLVATVGNTLGAMTSYIIGYYGADWFATKVLRISTAQQDQAERWYRRFGTWSLLLSWMPVVGDPLCLLGGFYRVRCSWFLLLVAAGKGLRYLTIAGLTGLILP
jgi:membrane protein YqaA with SNARE-associated domain